MFWRELGFIIFVFGIIIITIIIKYKKQVILNKKYWIWIIIIAIVIVCIVPISITRFLEKKETDLKRFSTIEEMAEVCMPDETIDYVLYYEKYAIVFLNDSDGEAMNWHPTNRNSNGWKGIDLKDFDYMRSILNINEGNLKIITVDREIGLDFIAYYPYKKYEEETKNKIFDSENSEFKYLKLPSGYEMCYTFVDIDKPGYEITVHGETLKMDDIDFGFSHIYDYGWHNKKLN